MDRSPKKSSNGIEKRFIPSDHSECRVSREDGKLPRISGYYARFSTPSTGLSFVEIIEPGFFEDALTRSDCVNALNHDYNYVFGRQSAGSADVEGGLTVYEDSVGLAYSCTPIDTQTARDMLIKPIDTGVLRGCSFAFRVKFDWDNPENDGDIWEYDKDTDTATRILKRNGCEELIDGSQVTHPAYDFSGGISMRSRDMAEAIRKRNDRRSRADIEYDGFVFHQLKTKYMEDFKL